MTVDAHSGEENANVRRRAAKARDRSTGNPIKMHRSKLDAIRLR